VPRSKPSRVEELRITLGTKERMMLEDALTSYRIQAISGKDGVVDAFSDATKVLGVLATFGALLELMGITDVFDFDEQVKEEVARIKNQILINSFQGREERARSLLGGLENIIRDALQNISGNAPGLQGRFRQG
jgi:hypothetical protein